MSTQQPNANQIMNEIKQWQTVYDQQVEADNQVMIAFCVGVIDGLRWALRGSFGYLTFNEEQEQEKEEPYERSNRLIVV